MELRQYGSVLMRRWPIWVGLALFMCLVSIFLSLRGPVAYEATIRLAVGTRPLPSSVGYYDPNYYAWISSEYLADDLSELLRSEAFAQDVSEVLGYRVDPRDLSNVVRTQKTHRMLDVTISAPTFEQALTISRAYEQVINTKLQSYFPQLQVQNAQVTVINRPKIERALTPAALAGTVALRTLVGLALGLALAFLVEYLDSSVRDRDEAERLTGAPVLGEIPLAR
jgi:capsular polysaccharide biosynthesis protein